MFSSEPKMEVKRWLQNGKLHRLDGPATICPGPNGYQSWCQNGTLHRIDGPAYLEDNGYQEWYFNGRLHRIDGPAIIYPDGKHYWYHDGQLHREYGPAVNYDSIGDHDWFDMGRPWTPKTFHHYIMEIALAIAPLKLSAYVVLWIFEWILQKEIKRFNQIKLINLFQQIKETH